MDMFSKLSGPLNHQRSGCQGSDTSYSPQKKPVSCAKRVRLLPLTLVWYYRPGLTHGYRLRYRYLKISLATFL
jgi:hypothetical protein